MLRATFQQVLKVDLFRVVQDRDAHLTPASKSGAVLSTVCAFLIAVLVLNESILFFSNDLRSSMFVAENKLKKELVHFNVSFPRFPCAVMGFEAYDPSTGTHIREHEESLKMKKFRLVPGTLVTMAPYVESPASRSANSNEGCRLEGTFYIDAVPGNFLLSASRGGFGQEIPLTEFVFHSLWFGDAEKLPRVMSHAPMLDTALFNTLRGQTHDEGYPPRTIYQFFLQIVPTYLKYEKTDEIVDIWYQYTAHHSTVTTEGVPPGIYFRHQHTPIAVEYVIPHKTWSHFLVQLCAIVGGVFTVVGFVVPAADIVRKKVIEPFLARRGAASGGAPGIHVRNE